MMATLNGTNVTKYDAGGSGDNIISDGYIKSVEKVWIDSYTLGTSGLTSATSICIGILPENARLTDIVVHLPILGVALTSATCYCCTGATVDTSTFFGTLAPDGLPSATAFGPATATTVRLASGYMNPTLPTGSTTKVYISIHQSDGKTMAGTGATIRSILKYT